jgi:hypothetical protein
MRSQEEVEQALTVLKRARKDERIVPDELTRLNLLGCEAALEWLLGDDTVSPVTHTLRAFSLILDDDYEALEAWRKQRQERN